MSKGTESGNFGEPAHEDEHPAAHPFPGIAEQFIEDMSELEEEKRDGSLGVDEYDVRLEELFTRGMRQQSELVADFFASLPTAPDDGNEAEVIAVDFASRTRKSE